jgi:hypothetical protein
MQCYCEWQLQEFLASEHQQFDTDAQNGLAMASQNCGNHCYTNFTLHAEAAFQNFALLHEEDACSVRISP